MFDSHCHLNFAAFDQNRDQVIKESQAKGIWLNLVGSQAATSKLAVELAQKYQQVVATVGVHPTHFESEKFDFTSLVGQPQVVAVGETGFDYYRQPREQVFEAQLKLLDLHLSVAQKYQKPIVFHLRADAKFPDQPYQDLVAYLTKNSLPAGGVIHCYSSNWYWAQKFLDLGLDISFTGIITYKNIELELLEVVSKIPPGRFLIETDAPYLTPEPYRGQTNLPEYVEQVALKIAELKGLEVGEVINLSTSNAFRFFRLAKEVN